MSTTQRLLCLLLLVFAPLAIAGEEDFHAGTLIEDFGQIATVKDAQPLPANTRLMVAFDVAKEAAEGEANRSLNSAARFLNMHVEAGVPANQLSVAIVVHGGASKDLLNADKLGHENPNAALITALLEAGTSITLCGQTAAYYDIEAADLLPGVDMVLSAMTQHALLQQQGFTLNPF